MTHFVRAFMRLVCLLAFLAATSPTLQAQQAAGPNTDRRSIAAARLTADDRITLDGAFDEPVWQRAPVAGNFIQIDPQNGQPATEATEVRIVYDRDVFYIGVTASDSEPDKWLGYQRRRDEFLSSDDRFMWTIDTFLDGRSGYFFEMNPSGLMADSLFGPNGDNRQWDGIWDARVRHTTTGWTIEIAIPFRTVNFNPDSDTWGINFQRTVRRKNEDSIWMGWGRNQGLRRMVNAGTVTGIRDVTQGHGLDIKPYGLFTSQSSAVRAGGEFDKDGNAGVDLFYNVTPQLRANLTLNTDFAQTEVDQRQVNLTRFSLFFPERRDFFLDGSTFFDFGSPIGGDLKTTPFFSRRIGLGADAEPQAINYGTKLTGQMGRQDVGFMHVSTGEGDDNSQVGEEFTVGRVKRRLLTQSYIGGIYTRRDPRTGDGAVRQTAGMDARFATNTLGGSQNFDATFWFLHATQPGLSSGNNAFGAHLVYPNDRWTSRFDATEIQEHFDPAVGFVSRRNYRRVSPNLGFQPRPRASRIVRQFIFLADLDLQTDLKNNVLTRTVQFIPLEVRFQSQDIVATEFWPSHERLDAPFAIAPGITLPVGSQYDFNRYIVRAQTANRRKLAFDGRYSWGGFYSGTRRELVANITVRLRPGYIVYLTGERNTVDLREGSFETKLYRLVGETQFTPFMALVNNVQYDTQGGVLGWQSRFRWIMKPGNDLYMVYTHNWLDQPLLDRFATLNKTIAAKVLYTHRF